jgi:stage IV sporulation protein FB
MLGEPAPTQGDIHFRLFGIPVRIHPFFWLVALILGARDQKVIEILIWIAAVLVSILIHELGHALVVRAFGFHPWIVLHGMGGLTCHDPAENYRSNANTPLGQITISFAGPAAGFALAAALVMVLYLAGRRDQMLFEWIFNVIPLPVWINPTSLAVFVNDVFWISIFWGLVNLLPIYPLDGGQIAREFFIYFSPGDGIRQSLMLSILTAAIISALALIRLRDLFICLFFAYLAYESFMALQAYTRGGRW